MTKPVLVLTLAALGASPACGPSDSVNPRVETASSRDGRASSDQRPADAGATPDDIESGPATPPGPSPDALVVDAAADLAPTPDAPPAPVADAPADLRPIDLPPDLPPPRPDLPPDLPPDTQPPGPWVMVAHAPAQPLTNLTMTGTLDWAHFGQGGSATRVNRKATAMGGPMRITMTSVGGNEIFPYDDRPVRFAWTDGTPTAQAAGTAEGISNGDVAGRGFELRVPGDVARARQLKVYWGVWGGRARMIVRLSDDSVPAIMDTTLMAGNPGADRITTIQFRTSQPAQTLVVRWTIETISMEYGNVTLQAATLE